MRIVAYGNRKCHNLCNDDDQQFITSLSAQGSSVAACVAVVVFNRQPAIKWQAACIAAECRTQRVIDTAAAARCCL
jgi:hypothetical protein